MDQNTKLNGGSWSIVLEDNRNIVTDHNPNFGQAKQKSSYRKQVCAFISTILFLHHYSKYYEVQLNNNFTTQYDNQVYVNKLKELTEDAYHFRNPYLQRIPSYFTIHRIDGHQDDNTKRKRLSTYAKLNTYMDHIATSTMTMPINNHISSISFVVCVNNIYKHKTIYHRIRQ